MIRIIKVYEIIETNCYLYLDEETKHGFIIDPGANGEKIAEYIEENGFVIEKILITHGHFDHIGAVNYLKKKLDIPVCMYKGSREYVVNSMKNQSANYGREIYIEIDDKDELLEDGALISLSTNPKMTLKLIHTPGHTLDSSVYYNEEDEICFVGDTIFLGSIGRTDFYGGSIYDIEKSIREKIYALPGDTTLLSGHTDPTTVDTEKAYGYFRD
jgi:glyoxylase-like metal-dependent hydrolase (beta-lactamase superfamily II)